METPKQENMEEPTRRSFLKNMLGGAAAFAGLSSNAEASQESKLTKEQQEIEEARYRKMAKLRNSWDYNNETIDILNSLSEEDLEKINNFDKAMKENMKDIGTAAAIGGAAGAAIGAIAGATTGRPQQKKGQPENKPKIDKEKMFMGSAFLGTAGAMIGAVGQSTETGGKNWKMRDALFEGKYGLESFADNLRKQGQPMTHNLILSEIKRLKEVNSKLKEEYDRNVEEHNAAVSPLKGK